MPALHLLQIHTYTCIEDAFDRAVDCQTDEELHPCTWTSPGSPLSCVPIPTFCVLDNIQSRLRNIRNTEGRGWRTRLGSPRHNAHILALSHTYYDCPIHCMQGMSTSHSCICKTMLIKMVCTMVMLMKIRLRSTQR